MVLVCLLWCFLVRCLGNFDLIFILIPLLTDNVTHSSGNAGKKSISAWRGQHHWLLQQCCQHTWVRRVHPFVMLGFLPPVCSKLLSTVTLTCPQCLATCTAPCPFFNTHVTWAMTEWVDLATALAEATMHPWVQSQGWHAEGCNISQHLIDLKAMTSWVLLQLQPDQHDRYPFVCDSMNLTKDQSLLRINATITGFLLSLENDRDRPSLLVIGHGNRRNFLKLLTMRRKNPRLLHGKLVPLPIRRCLGSLVDRSLPRVGVLALTCVLCFPFLFLSCKDLLAES